jgi:hypothetical protein
VYNLVFSRSREKVADKPKDQNEIVESPGGGKVRRVSADGMRWVVREVPAPSFDRRGGTHLLFDGETVMRRVRAFPENWYDLSDGELYELCRRITPL